MEQEQQEAAAKVNKSLLSIDYMSTGLAYFRRDNYADLFSENVEIDDYLKEGDVGFKKPKVYNFALNCTCLPLTYGPRRRRRGHLDGRQKTRVSNL